MQLIKKHIWPAVAVMLLIIVIVLAIQNYNLHKLFNDEYSKTVPLAKYEYEIKHYEQELERCQSKMQEYKVEAIKYEGMDWELYNGLDIDTLDRIYTSAKYNNGLYAVNHPIEMDYIYDRPDAYSTREMIEWTEQYRARWEEEAEKHEKLIADYEREEILELGYEGEEVPELFEAYNQVRKEYKEAEELFYSGLYESQHGRGSMSRLMAHSARVNIEREHALALMTIHSVLYGENMPIEW